MELKRFEAKIYVNGINPYIDIPKVVSDSFGKRGPIPVKGLLNEAEFKGTLVPKGRERYLLYLNNELRKKAKVGVGDLVSVHLELDTSERVLRLVPELKKALEKERKARVAFDNLSASKQREILAYLNYLKSSEAIKRNVEKVIKFLMRHERLERKGKRS